MTYRDIFKPYLLPTRAQEIILRKEKTIDVERASLLLGRSKNKIREMIKEGKLEAEKIKNKWQIYTKSIYEKITTFREALEESEIKKKGDNWVIIFDKTLYINFMIEDVDGNRAGRLIKIRYLDVCGVKTSREFEKPKITIGIFYDRGVPTRIVMDRNWNVKNLFDTTPTMSVGAKWILLSWHIFYHYFLRS